MRFWTELKITVKWIVRVACTVAVIFLLGAAVAALYRDSAPDMYVWFAKAISRIF